MADKQQREQGGKKKNMEKSGEKNKLFVLFHGNWFDTLQV